MTTRDKARAREIKGIIITLVAGALWGFTGTCSQFLFENFNITPLFLTNVRMVFAGMILLIFSFVKLREDVTALLKERSNIIRLVAFAFLGILFNQLSYLEAISHTNSATATILQYIGPVLIMVVSCFMSKRLPNKKEVIAIILVLVGTWLMATHGDFGSLYLTPKGLVWGLMAAVAVVTYTMIPIPLIKKYGSIPVVGMGMLIGGLGLSAVNRFQGGPAEYSGRFFFFLSIVVVVGTVIGYTAYLVGVDYCGAVKASMIASIEPVSAALCMVLWLKEPFYPIDIVGFLCIFVTVFLLAKNEEEPSPKSEGEHS